MPASPVDLTVIMCVYNEMGRVQPALDDFLASAARRPETWQALLIDNGSIDGTREWLRELTHPSVRVVLNPENLGKGGSIKRGIELSVGRHVVVHDPDMEYSAEDIWPLLDLARSSGAGLVLGSRALGGNVAYRYPMNYAGVRFLTFVTNLLFGSRLTDTATAMKLLDGDLARRMRLTSTGFDLDFELVTRTLRLGYPVLERRVRYYPRTRAEGKKIRAFVDGPLGLRAILRDRLLPRSRFLKPAASASMPAEQGPDD